MQNQQEPSHKYSKPATGEGFASYISPKARPSIHPEMAAYKPTTLKRFNEPNNATKSSPNDDDVTNSEDSDSKDEDKYHNSDEAQLYPSLSELKRRNKQEVLNKQSPKYDTRQQMDSKLKLKPTDKPHELTSAYLLLGIVLLVIVGCAVYAYKTGAFKVGEEAELAADVHKQWSLVNLKRMSLIGKDFPSQTKTIWTDFFAGLKKVLKEKPTEPSVFLLLHHDNEMTTRCLARRVAATARDLMNVSRDSLLELDGATLRMSDRGQFIAKYKPLVERHRVMVVNDLHMLPAEIARSLHPFCDTVTPIVDMAVYIFTVNVNGDRWGNGRESPTSMAESELNAMWNELDSDILQPLVIRITGGTVHKINPETNVKHC